MFVVRSNNNTLLCPVGGSDSLVLVVLIIKLLMFPELKLAFLKSNFSGSSFNVILIS